MAIGYAVTSCDLTINQSVILFVYGCVCKHALKRKTQSANEVIEISLIKTDYKSV